MIWSNKLFSGISELVGQCSGSQSGELYRTCGHPLHRFANTRVFYAAIRKAQRSVHLQSLLWWVTDRAVWERPINQPCSLIILLFAVLFLSQISSPVQLAGQLPKHFQCRPEGEKQKGGQERNWGLHQLALLFKGVLHFKANQPLNCNSSLDVTTGWLVCLAQACGNLDLGMSIMAKE